MPMELRPHRICGVVPALFLARHAIGPNDAIAFLPRDPAEQADFDRLRARGIVRQTVPGNFYYDLDAHYVAIERRRRFVVPVAIVVSILIAWIATWFFRG